MTSRTDSDPAIALAQAIGAYLRALPPFQAGSDSRLRYEILKIDIADVILTMSGLPISPEEYQARNNPPDVLAGVSVESTKYRREPLPDVLRWEIFERDDFRCCGCGSRRLLQIDHVIPVVAGGQTVACNLRTLCRACNNRKGASL